MSAHRLHMPDDAAFRAPLSAGPRYVIALCPDPHGPAGLAGAEWVGRCVARNAPVPQPWLPGLSPSFFAALTEEPRRVGFCAILRGPFGLATGISRQGLRRKVAEIASAHCASYLPFLRPRIVEDCLALAPDEGAGLHYTLTGPLTMFGEELAEHLAAQAAQHFETAMHELRCADRIALLEQHAPGASFCIVATSMLPARKARVRPIRK